MRTVPWKTIQPQKFLRAAENCHLCCEYSLVPRLSIRANDAYHSVAPQLVASRVRDEIEAAGGKAVANYDSVEDGEKIIQTAIDTFGHIDILINNAGILRDKSFKNMTDRDFDFVYKVHLAGTFKCTKAAWPYFVRQGHGRIINTTSASGLFGNFGQVNYASAKLAIVGLTKALAVEGKGSNIFCNAICPVVASRMTETVMSPEELMNIRPELVAPFVAFLVHRSTTSETGSIFEIGGGHMGKLRWQRTQCLQVSNNTPISLDELLLRWNRFNCSDPSRPSSDAAYSVSPSVNPAGLRFDGRVVIVTAGSTPTGRHICKQLASLGACVVINDSTGTGSIVAEIQHDGGRAIGCQIPPGKSDILIKTALQTFGKIDILIDNDEYPLRRPFGELTELQWESTVHDQLRGNFQLLKAAYPYMTRQKYGRIVCIFGSNVLGGNVGASEQCAAKHGILGMAKTLAIEGRKNNILVNSVSVNPEAGLSMSEDCSQHISPANISSLVLLLASDRLPEPSSGLLLEIDSRSCSTVGWQRTRGYSYPTDGNITPEMVASKWQTIVDFDNGLCDHPKTSQEGVKYVMESAFKGKRASTSKL
ncbi:hypothetical protein LTS17_005634 [Exophiala oligosperma]